MICILAPNFNYARNWASNQGLERSEWFYAENTETLNSHQNFHVIVVGEFPDYQLPLFEKTYHLAKQRGAINRK